MIVAANERPLAVTPEMRTKQLETVHARVYTFHVTSEQLDNVGVALDDAVADLARHADFRGLLYLERGEPRHEVLGLTLWAGDGIDDTEPNAERSRQKIADTADTGVYSRNFRVLRHFQRQPTALFVTHWGEQPMADAG
jgi:hypothetical protein